MGCTDETITCHTGLAYSKNMEKKQTMESPTTGLTWNMETTTIRLSNSFDLTVS